MSRRAASRSSRPRRACLVPLGARCVFCGDGQFTVAVRAQDEAERETLGKTELPAELMAKLVLAPQGWAATGSLRFSTPDGGGQLVGEDKEPTVVNIAVEVLKSKCP